MRISERRSGSSRQSGPARGAGPGSLDARATNIALALIILFALAAVPLLRDERVVDNLGAGFRSLAGAKSP